MKGTLTPPPHGPLRCVYCSTVLILVSVEDEAYSFVYQAHQCPDCGQRVLSLEQLHDYNVLRDEAAGCL